MKKYVLLISHGSREKSANREFIQITRKYQARHPEWKIGYAFLELAKPSIPEVLEAIAAQSDKIIVLPYFLFVARHVKKDIPVILKIFQKKYPRVKVRLSKPLGSDSRLLDILDQRLDNIIKK